MYADRASLFSLVVFPLRTSQGRGEVPQAFQFDAVAIGQFPSDVLSQRFENGFDVGRGDRTAVTEQVANFLHPFCPVQDGTCIRFLFAAVMGRCLVNAEFDFSHECLYRLFLMLPKI